jgi:hypothetical protein
MAKGKDYLTGYLCVFRNTPDDPWAPIGSLRHEVHESIGATRDIFEAHILSYPTYGVGSEQRHHFVKWAKRARDIHSGETEPYVYTALDGRQYALLSVRITALSPVADVLLDPVG